MNQTATYTSFPIELYQVLKREGVVQSGGEAKHVISEGLVQVNRAVETRKRKKLAPGDVIEFAGATITLASPTDS